MSSYVAVLDVGREGLWQHRTAARQFASHVSSDGDRIAPDAYSDLCNCSEEQTVETITENTIAVSTHDVWETSMVDLRMPDIRSTANALIRE